MFYPTYASVDLDICRGPPLSLPTSLNVAARSYDRA
jgi:hypothetical protein